MMAQRPFFLPSPRRVNLVKDPQPNDVLMGRGVVKNSYTGNVRFRAIVDERKREYLHESCKKRKREIAQDVFEKVQQTGGRFLKPVQVNLHGRLVREDCWEEVHVLTAIEKCMQALRDRERPLVLPFSEEGSKAKDIRQDLDDEGADPSELRSNSRDDKSKATGTGGTDGGSADLLLFLKNNPRDFHERELTSSKIPASSRPTTHSGSMRNTIKACPLELPAQSSMPPQHSVNLQAENPSAQNLQRMEGSRIFQKKPLLNLASPQSSIMLGFQRPPPPLLVISPAVAAPAKPPPPHLVISPAAAAKVRPAPPHLVISPAAAAQARPAPLHLVSPPAQARPSPPHLVISPAVAAQARTNGHLQFPPNVQRQPPVPPMQPTQQQPVRSVRHPGNLPMHGIRQMLPTTASSMPTSRSILVNKILASGQQQRHMPVGQSSRINEAAGQPNKTSKESQERTFVSMQDICAITGRFDDNARDVILTIFEQKNERRPSNETIKRRASPNDCLDTTISSKRARIGR